MQHLLEGLVRVRSVFGVLVGQDHRDGCAACAPNAAQDSPGGVRVSGRRRRCVVDGARLSLRHEAVGNRAFIRGGRKLGIAPGPPRARARDLGAGPVAFRGHGGVRRNLPLGISSKHRRMGHVRGDRLQRMRPCGRHPMGEGSRPAGPPVASGIHGAGFRRRELKAVRSPTHSGVDTRERQRVGGGPGCGGVDPHGHVYATFAPGCQASWGHGQREGLPLGLRLSELPHLDHRAVRPGGAPRVEPVRSLQRAALEPLPPPRLGHHRGRRLCSGLRVHSAGPKGLCCEDVSSFCSALRLGGHWVGLGLRPQPPPHDRRGVDCAGSVHAALLVQRRRGSRERRARAVAWTRPGALCPRTREDRRPDQRSLRRRVWRRG
mmetsp:Transcript_3744/g.11252  ORF Transcript_3744/g.11252 Transcript_3744/m.11252 type:complete len:376 (+) Transcript_3744:1082-2209(+)